jgi:hypothetical protein
MKTKKTLTVLLLLGFVALFNACDKDDDPCTCPIKAHLAQGQTCTCGGKDCNCTVAQPIDKTYIITLKDTKNNDLVFTVAYKALPSDAEPTYLAYLQTRLGAISTNAVFEDEVNHLISVGNSFTITVEYANTVYEGIKWNATTRTFTIHNDWIITATGTDLSAGMMAEAFRSVQAE